MYEDIIKIKKGGLNWDWNEYKKEAYCPVCGSINLENTKDILKDQKLTNYKRCKDCGMEWKEIFNKNLDLELTEAVFCKDKI